MPLDETAAGSPYAGPIEPGMVFDFEPGKKHKYERLTVTKKLGPQLWCRGRCGETFHDEPDFRRSVVFVSATPLAKQSRAPLQLNHPYAGPIEVDMVFDFEPGKRHMYERLTITQIKGPHIWARGRCGATYYEEPEFRNRVVPVLRETR